MSQTYSSGVLQRIRASRWVRFTLLAVIVAFCCYGLAAEWPQVHVALGRMRWYSVAGSAAAAMAGAACMMLAWRVLLADLGSRLPVPVTARVTFVSQLAKYVPGAIWSFAAHVELGYDYKVPRRRGAASVLVALAVAVGVGLMIAALALPLAAPSTARRYLIVLAAIPLIGLCLCPPVLHRLLDRALDIIRQPRLEKRPSWRGLSIAVALTTLGWLFLGLQAWLLLADVAGASPRTAWLALGGFAFACSAALLLVVFPSGIGARELLLVAAVAPVIAHGPALAVALVARAVTTASDLALGGIGLVIGRASQLAGSPAQLGAPGRQAGRHRKPGRLALVEPPPEVQAFGTSGGLADGAARQ
jgi:uncharacterized membrane protein YbhN (UPF0104 family)